VTRLSIGLAIALTELLVPLMCKIYKTVPHCKASEHPSSACVRILDSQYRDEVMALHHLPVLQAHGPFFIHENPAPYPGQ
jgi:hypothetical protein